MPFGHISRLMSQRAIGFVVEDGSAEELEFHQSALIAGSLDQLQEGQRVQFETRPDHRDPGKRRAVDVSLVGRP